MAKENSRLWVSDSFACMIEKIQNEIREQTGREISYSDITAAIAATPPVIKVIGKEKKKDWINEISL